jgi:uncharacterized membrane protein
VRQCGASRFVVQSVQKGDREFQLRTNWRQVLFSVIGDVLLPLFVVMVLLRLNVTVSKTSPLRGTVDAVKRSLWRSVWRVVAWLFSFISLGLYVNLGCGAGHYEKCNVAAS